MEWGCWWSVIPVESFDFLFSFSFFFFFLGVGVGRVDKNRWQVENRVMSDCNSHEKLVSSVLQ